MSIIQHRRTQRKIRCDRWEFENWVGSEQAVGLERARSAEQALGGVSRTQGWGYVCFVLLCMKNDRFGWRYGSYELPLD